LPCQNNVSVDQHNRFRVIPEFLWRGSAIGRTVRTRAELQPHQPKDYFPLLIGHLVWALPGTTPHDREGVRGAENILQSLKRHGQCGIPSAPHALLGCRILGAWGRSPHTKPAQGIPCSMTPSISFGVFIGISFGISAGIPADIHADIPAGVFPVLSPVRRPKPPGDPQRRRKERKNALVLPPRNVHGKGSSDHVTRYFPRQKAGFPFPTLMKMNMAIDKFRGYTYRKPCREQIDRWHEELALPRELRRHEFIFFSQRTPNRIDPTSDHIRIFTKRKIVPAVMVELNCIAPGGKLRPMTVFETNPNNYNEGCRGFLAQIDSIFGDDCPDLTITREDFNADIEDISVESLRTRLRWPGKRKSGGIGIETYDDRGLQTYRMGRRPHEIRVYDKIQEFRYRHEDVSRFPAILTRVEVEAHGNKLPIRLLSEFHSLLQFDPFDKLQVLESHDNYDFRNRPKHSALVFLYNKLAQEKGASEAARIMNVDRNFARLRGSDISDNSQLKDKLTESYFQTTKRFFENKGSSVKHVYLNCGICNAQVPELQVCSDCNARMCLPCSERENNRDSACSLHGGANDCRP